MKVCAALFKGHTIKRQRFILLLKCCSSHIVRMASPITFYRWVLEPIWLESVNEMELTFVRMTCKYFEQQSFSLHDYLVLQECSHMWKFSVAAKFVWGCLVSTCWNRRVTNSDQYAPLDAKGCPVTSLVCLRIWWLAFREIDFSRFCNQPPWICFPSQPKGIPPSC